MDLSDVLVATWADVPSATMAASAALAAHSLLATFSFGCCNAFLAGCVHLGSIDFLDLVVWSLSLVVVRVVTVCCTIVIKAELLNDTSTS